MERRGARIGHRRRMKVMGALLAVFVVLGLASVASAHDVTGIDVDCSTVKVHFADFPGGGVPVHIVVTVAYVWVVKDVNVDKNTTEVSVDISGATARLTGQTSGVWVDATWTNFGDQHVHEVTSVKCGEPPTTTTSTSTSTSTTSTTVAPTTGTQIFQVEIRDCHLLHVGYEHIPAGTTVHWEVFMSGKSRGTGQWVAATGPGLHFLNMPIPDPFPKTGKALVNFSWTANGTSYTYSVVRLATTC
jgi:uncharacterized membrane protein